MKTLFRENQKFNIFLSLVVLIPLATAFVLPIYRQMVKLGIPFNDVAVINLIPVLIIFLIIAIVCLAKLETIITNNGITIGFFPFLFEKRTILWEDIKEAYVRDYHPVSEYGGWGVPFVKLPTMRGVGNNRALNTKGNKGLQLILNDGTKLLIGTQKPDELKKLLEQLEKY